MKQIRKEVDKDAVRKTASRFGIDLLTASILERRGLTSPESLKFIFESQLRFLHNPFDFVEMEDAVDRILAAVVSKEKMMVYGDRDADGITATVILVETLRKIGADVVYAVPEGDEDYSLRRNDIDRCVKDGISLIITVDCGISCVAEAAYADSVGVDLVITDHHNPGEDVPSAVAVINPKLGDSGYPYENIAGCVVALKLSFALLFGQTAFYNRPMILMNIFNGNDGFFFIETLTLQNLTVTDEFCFSVHPDHDNSDVFETLSGICSRGTVYFYDSSYQLNILKSVFPEELPLNAVDLFDEINKFVPEASGFSLFKMKNEPFFTKYEENPHNLREIDIFRTLFTAYFFKKFASLFSQYYYCMDLAALGTIGDVMPLQNENRIIVKVGIGLINQKRRQAIRELLFRQNCFRNVTATDLAFKVTPLLNATGRMGVPDKAIRFLLSDDIHEIQTLAGEILEINERRKQIGNEAWQSISQKADLSFQKNGEKFVFVYDPQLNRGLTGIMAMRLTQKYGVPAIVAAPVDGNKIVGSMRSSGGVKARAFLEQFSDLFNDFGGHDGAAGFNLNTENAPAFGKRLTELVRESEIRAGNGEITVDAFLPPQRMNESIMKVVDFLAPFGEGMSEPVFSCRDAVIVKCETIGAERQHVKLTVKIGEFFWPALYWNAAALIDVDFSQGDSVEMVFTLNRNFYKNDVINQIIVKDIVRS